MKLTDDCDWSASPQKYSISEAVERHCNGSDYDRGQVETLEATTENTYELIGRLVETLAAKGLLSKSDIGTILPLFSIVDES